MTQKPSIAQAKTPSLTLYMERRDWDWECASEVLLTWETLVSQVELPGEANPSKQSAVSKCH